MIATSTVVMFGLMYLNMYQLDHVFFSETRLGHLAFRCSRWTVRSGGARRSQA